MSLLSRKGYIIDKTSLTEDELKDIKEDLIVEPFVKHNYGSKPEKFAVYLENENRICIPKFYGLEKFGQPDKIIKPKITKINVKFNGQLRKKQLKPYNTAMEGIKELGGGILSIPCGGGKTVLSLKIISTLGVKTLIIVHKTFLLDQWKERIQTFIPDARIGIIKQKKIITDDVDIVIGMVQSISMIDYHKSIFGGFGLTVIDEVHRISSKIFSRALPKTSTKYTLGLSATPYRDDGLSKIFHWYLGEMLYKSEQGENKSVVVKCYNFTSPSPKFKVVLNRFTKKPSNSTMITNLTEIDTRNKFIVSIILKIMIDDRRQILVLSDRLDHLRLLKNIIEMSNKNLTTGFYIGGMKEKALNESHSKNIIFGTYPMASEGLDIPSLNTLILATPRSKIVQSVGRILRKERNDINPLIIDIIDEISTFKNQGYKRKRFYKKKKYGLQEYFVDDGAIENGLGNSMIIEQCINDVEEECTFIDSE